MKDTNLYDVIIMGSGPAGYTAAIYAARGNLKTMLFSGKEPGGQLMITTEVENFPGFPKGITGPQLMVEMKEQAKRFGTDIIEKAVMNVNFSVRPFEITANGEKYYSQTCILATGASAQWLGIESETKFKGKGISGCATCDGFFFKNKDIIVVGGGDSAMEESLYLTKFVNSIKILVRRDVLRASAIMKKRAESNPKIQFLYNTEVKEFIGKDRLESVNIVNNKTMKESNLTVQGAFVAIGHKPNTEIFKGQIELDPKGYIVRQKNSQTSVEGIFAAGDVHDHHYRQAITAAGYGSEAAIDAIKYLEEK